MLMLSKGFKTMGKVMSQIHKEKPDISSDKISTQHLHFTMAAEYGTACMGKTMLAK